MSELPFSDLIITNLMDIKEKLGSLDQKIDSMTSQFNIHVRDDHEALAQIDVRLSKLEDAKKKLMWTLTAFWAVILGLVEFLKIWLGSK